MYTAHELFMTNQNNGLRCPPLTVLKPTPLLVLKHLPFLDLTVYNNGKGIGVIVDPLTSHLSVGRGSRLRRKGLP